MEKEWWHNKVAYQIYPKSFYDTNGDGIGDIRGIIEKLDYLKELGIDIVWISPIYKSPFVDQGYDISDYYSIAEEFGTMEDFDELLREAKKRDIYILMDLVINHCSDKHKWFQKALADPEGKYSNYFYFVDGINGKEPSNYRSYFGGSAWEKVPGTNKYYLHMFAKEQPDLNWENQELKGKLFEMINWWLDKGLAGFRIDAIINIKKNLNFPNFEPDGEDGLVNIVKMVEEVDGVGDMLKELREKTFDKYDAFTVGEVFNMKEGEVEKFIGYDGYFSTMFDFTHILLLSGNSSWYKAKEFNFKIWRDSLLESQLENEGIGFKANIIENHDEPRGASSYLPNYGQNNKGIKMLATVNILLKGIPFIYQGQEIGMKNCKMDSIDEYNDIDTINKYNEALNIGISEEEALNLCYKYSRDNARTPMQWDNSNNAGFTDGKPWLKVNPNYKDINVEAQLKDNNSILRYYQKLIALRKSEKYGGIFTYGKVIPVFQENDELFAYYRSLNDRSILVIANFGDKDNTFNLDDNGGEIILSNYNRIGCLRNKVMIKSCEVISICMF